jgi:sentrin-specific protease 1
MGGKNYECVQALRCYLQEESLDKKKKEFDMSDWTLDNIKVWIKLLFSLI